MTVEERPPLDPLAPTKSEVEANDESNIDPSDLLIVTVGHDLDQHNFSISRSAACAQSRVLAAACDKLLTTTTTTTTTTPDGPVTLRLRDMHTYNFALYATWLHHRTLSIEPSTYKGPVRRHSKESYSHPIVAYVVGEQLKDIALRNAALDKCSSIHNKEGIIPSLYHIEYVWEHTREAASIRVWLLDVWSVEVDEESFVELMDSLPGGFVSGVVRRVFRLRERAKRALRLVDDARVYHERD